MTATTRARTWLPIGAVVVLALAAYLLLGGGQPEQRGYLDPANPGPDGARAVAQVLSDQGVDVTVVRSADELEGADPGADTTVVVTSTELLGMNTGPRMQRDAEHARLVLVEPGPGVTATLGYTAGSRVDGGDRRAFCAEPDFAHLDISVQDGVEYPTVAGCFTGDQGYLVAFPAPDVTLLGAGGLLRNDTVTRADNAAVALRLLGHRPRLVWYVPSASDLGADDGVALGSLLPRWVRPALWVLLFTTVGLLLWRGRRLGALVTEPLPVTVRSIETTAAGAGLAIRQGERIAVTRPPHHEPRHGRAARPTSVSPDRRR
ncbi:MAG: DUF4350 domain-containing protein [Nocardioides sp.]